MSGADIERIAVYRVGSGNGRPVEHIYEAVAVWIASNGVLTVMSRIVNTVGPGTVCCR